MQGFNEQQNEDAPDIVFDLIYHERRKGKTQWYFC